MLEHEELDAVAVATPDHVHRDAAVDALVAAGFTVGDISEGGTGAPGTVTGPKNLALAEPGEAINIVAAPGAGATKFVFMVVGTKTARRTIGARVSVSRAATVATTLYGPRGMKLASWKLKVRAGRTNVKLRIPAQVRRAGRYSMKWTATSAGARITRTTHFRPVARATTRRR
jgi:hypothetical protein